MELADRTCRPCRGGDHPLRPDELAPLAAAVPAWRVVDHHHLERELLFADFRSALDTAVAVGAEAEALGHHPDIGLAWGRLSLRIWTHAIDGLSEADFILAARIDRLVTARGDTLEPRP